MNTSKYFSKKNNLVNFRNQLGWSRERFAVELDIDSFLVLAWENGTKFPDTNMCLMLERLKSKHRGLKRY